VDAVLEVCNSENLKLTTVLTTHHHLDHSGILSSFQISIKKHSSGGNYEIASKMKDIKVVGFSGEKRIPSMNTPLSHGQTIQVHRSSIQNCAFLFLISTKLLPQNYRETTFQPRRNFLLFWFTQNKSAQLFSFIE
jgi:hypothetical protein